MVTLRKRGRTTTEQGPVNHNNEGTLLPNGSTKEQEEGSTGYEQFRDKRIKENMERMQKLGIIDLSLKLKSALPTRRTSRNTPERKTPNNPSLLLLSGPPRRSSRLNNVAPVSYSERPVSRKDKSGSLEDTSGPWVGEGVRPEIYAEEHEKLLGTFETPWTLFVDGCGKDGKRIYDPVKGKTCHQCRQKTLGLRTHCYKCNLVQGQFCGDCLYMRYGENVLEANQNPNWICPVCRGICNCSLCRQSKGWVPTGTLYRKISSLGYKSVAHYLIQTRRSQTNSEELPAMEELPVSAKRSIPFADSEEPSRKKPLDCDDGDHECSKPLFEDNNETTVKKVEGNSRLTMIPDLATEVCHDSIGGRLSLQSNKDTDFNRSPKSTIGNSQDDDNFRVGKEQDTRKEGISDIASESNQKPQMELASPRELNPDSIVRKLRPRHNRS